MKKLFSTSILALLLLIAWPTYFDNHTLVAEIRQEEREGRDTESIRDRDLIICGQQEPEKPREPRGEYPTCPVAEPTTLPVEPTSPSTEVTATPGVGGPTEPTVTPKSEEAEPGPTATPEPGVGGPEVAAAVAEEEVEAPSIVELAPTSGEGILMLEVIRLSGVLWLLLSGKGILLALKGKGS